MFYFFFFLGFRCLRIYYEDFKLYCIVSPSFLFFFVCVCPPFPDLLILCFPVDEALQVWTEAYTAHLIYIGIILGKTEIKIPQ